MSDSLSMGLAFGIAPGVIVVHDGSLVVIEQRLADGKVRVRSLATGVQSAVLIASLSGRPSGTLTELFDTRDERRGVVKDADWTTALARERVVQGLLAEKGPFKLRLVSGASTLGVSTRQMETWVSRYRCASHTSAMLDKKDGRRFGIRQLDQARERVLRETIDECYLKQPRLKPEDIHKETKRRCKAAGLVTIARGTINARLLALDPERVARGRHGVKYAQEKIAAVPGTFVVDGALDVVQIDHTQVDLQVVDETFRLPIGRPWISVAIDVATRMVCGFYLTLQEPS